MPLKDVRLSKAANEQDKPTVSLRSSASCTTELSPSNTSGPGPNLDGACLATVIRSLLRGMGRCVQRTYGTLAPSHATSSNAMG
jgi:hypothetical protein